MVLSSSGNGKSVPSKRSHILGCRSVAEVDDTGWIVVVVIEAHSLFLHRDVIKGGQTDPRVLFNRDAGSEGRRRVHDQHFVLMRSSS